MQYFKSLYRVIYKFDPIVQKKNAVCFLNLTSFNLLYIKRNIKNNCLHIFEGGITFIYKKFTACISEST